jgi:hypothetical protein
MNSLRMRFCPDNDGTGELEAHVSSDEFAGVGRAWFNVSDIAEFAQSLRAFPLTLDHAPAIQGGYGEQCNLKLCVRPYDARGLLLVKVDLATRIWNADDREGQQKISARFVTEYAAVNRFADELSRLVDEKIDEAVLIGRE